MTMKPLFVTPWFLRLLTVVFTVATCEAEITIDIPGPDGAHTDIAPLTSEKGAQEPEQSGPPRLVMDLSDGSRLIGLPTSPSLRLHTSFADIDVKMTAISTIKMAQGTNSTSVTFANGDKLQGELEVDAIGVQTLFGRHSIPCKFILELRVLSGAVDLPADLQKDLILYYSFGRNGEVVDDSGNGNHGKAHGAKWSPKGVSGGAYAFSDEEDTITASPHGLPTGDASRTVSFWFKLNAPPAQGVDGFVSWGTQQHNQYCVIGFDQRVNRYGISFSQWGAVDVSSKKIKQAGTWHHAVCVYSGNGETKFYLDGINHGLQADEIRSRIATSKSGDLKLGTGKCDGLLDEVMIYTRTLSEKEIKRIYDLQKQSLVP